MNSAVIAHDTRVSTKCIDFTDDLTLCDSTHSGVTRHLTNDAHVHGDEQGRGPEVGGSSSGFIASVPCSDHYNVVSIVDHEADWWNLAIHASS